MKIVYTANKNSYGADFMYTFDSLEELKRGIFDHEHCYDDPKPEYNEKSSLEAISNGKYNLLKVELHDDEVITFGEYDGQSWVEIVKKKVEKILSKTTPVPVV
jgi:6-pyruvoyl-tetrahydropterin synthase